MRGWRRTLTAVAVAAVVATLSACDAPVDTASPRTIGMLRVVVDEDHEHFVDELRRAGWSLGQDLRILPTDPTTTYDLDGARATLRAWRDEDVDLIVAFSTPFVSLVTEEAGDTPGLFLVNDPVSAGFVADPLHPEGQLTGVAFTTPMDRTLDLTDRIVGGLATIGYLAPAEDPAVPGHHESVLRAADAARIELVEATYDDPEAVGAAVQQLRRAGVDAVILANASGTVAALSELEAALASAGLPTVASTDVVGFAVLVVTPDGAEVRRQLARQASRLLAGADVRSVPVEAPRKFTVIVDRRQARELGLAELDADLLRQADVVR